MYRMETRLPDGAYKATLPFANLQAEWFLNKPDQLRFDLPMYTATFGLESAYPGLHEIWLYRGENLVFCGPLWDLTASSEQGMLTCSAEGLESYLQARRVNHDLRTSGQVANLAWQLIQATQAEPGGELGIVRGVNPATPETRLNIRRGEGTYIYDVIDDLSQHAGIGFDWQITSNTRAFDVWHPRRYFTARVTLAYDTTSGTSGTGGTGGNSNVKQYAMQIMGKYLRNDILTAGESRYVTSIDPTSRTRYGLRQYTDSYRDADTLSQLRARARLVGALRREPKFVPSVIVDGSVVNPLDGDIGLGDKTRVVIHDDLFDFDRELRCIGWQLTLDKHGGETFALYLNDLREVDDNEDGSDTGAGAVAGTVASSVVTGEAA